MQAIFNNWNLSLGTDILKLKGRQLPNEAILFQNREINYNHDQADWSRECRTQSIHDAIPLDRWIMVFHADDRNAAETIYKEMRHQCSRVNWKIEEPTM